ncbi:hypothetical protein E2C01_023775 [Portunus trituberculatus]|uniref:Uncharacterized protein n=1 Tax=Portunus trituberculatus TaxID=210409 RepID=A0A5B7EA21_PORTR|nr:hypothetical protein [Portunus trituberculatus]
MSGKIPPAARCSEGDKQQPSVMLKITMQLLPQVGHPTRLCVSSSALLRPSKRNLILIEIASLGEVQPGHR